MTADAPFVLDLDTNPHPKMLAGAIEAHDHAAHFGFDPWDPATIYWRGYLSAMVDATGCSAEELTAWVRRGGGR